MRWISDNKEWVFSGAGVVIISSICGGLCWLWTRTRRRPTPELRTDRREARNALLAFADFCLSYQALHHEDSPDRARDLTAEIRTLKSSIEALGPLSMPELAPLLSDVVAHAWNFQRLLDRQGGSAPPPIEPGFKDLEDNLDGITAWFADVKSRIKTEIDPHLGM